jgi:hypothetical protein
MPAIVTTKFLIRALFRALADGVQTVFQTNLAEGLFYTPPAPSDPAAQLSRTFNPLQPMPSEVQPVSGSTFTVGLSGYLVTATFATAPAAGEVDLVMDLIYEHVPVAP